MDYDFFKITGMSKKEFDKQCQKSWESDLKRAQQLKQNQQRIQNELNRKLQQLEPKKEAVTKQDTKKEDPFWGDKVQATVLWLVVMAFGSIFHDRVWIWIIATAIWFIYITKNREVK